MNIQIRPARASDLPTVFSLSTSPKLAAPRAASAERWWIRAFLVERQPFFVALNKKQVVGFILGEYATGHVAIAQLLMVKPAYRKQGIGVALGQAFEQACRQKGMRCILLYASNHDKFFERSLRTYGYQRGASVREYQKMLPVQYNKPHHS